MILRYFIEPTYPKSSGNHHNTDSNLPLNNSQGVTLASVLVIVLVILVEILLLRRRPTDYTLGRNQAARFDTIAKNFDTAPGTYH